jgi:3-deoxy-7-phosphoheptulonate synthase
MIVVMQIGANEEQLIEVEKRLNDIGYKVFRSGEQQQVLGCVGAPKQEIDKRDIERMPGVREVIKIAKPFKLVSRVFRPEGSVIDVSGVKIGGDDFVVMAGPCAVESLEQMRAGAAAVKAAGAQILRGGAFKPRSSPYAFQGLGEEGLRYLRQAADEQQMPCVTEVLDTGDVELVAKYADMLQVGARNMQNFRLLAKLGTTHRPILLKRGLSATLEELLMAAEYIVSSGNPRVVLCERGVRTFEPWTRNTLDLSAIPVLRRLTHLPIIVDPSHATGVREYVIPMGRAGMAAGADGVIVEVHPCPDAALCDGAQSLTPEGFLAFMNDLRIMAPVVRKRVPQASKPLQRKLEKPIFDRAVIIGMGLIGGSLSLSLRETGCVGHLTGVEKDGVVDAARSAGLADEVVSLDSAAEYLKGADLVIIATPVNSIIETLGLIGPVLKSGCLVTDVGGTKVSICKAALKLPEGVHFVGGHPMAGSERRGPSAADPLLFHVAVYALCPVKHVPGELLSRLISALSAIGAQPLVLDADRHDLLAASVSHVPYLIASALLTSAGRLGETDELALRLAAGGFRDMTRTAASPFAVWKDVIGTNGAKIRERLADFRKALDGVESLLQEEEGLKKELEKAARYRLSIPHNLPGIQHSDTEILVRVLDQPGSLAGVATALARENVNVCDIQVLKIRQDEDGMMRLAFTDRPETMRAMEVLRKAGFTVSLREG